jgi:hypothetical protein
MAINEAGTNYNDKILPERTEPATEHDVTEGGLIGGVGGAVVGGLAGGPIGAVIGAMIGGAASAAAVELVDRNDHDFYTTPPTTEHPDGDTRPAVSPVNTNLAADYRGVDSLNSATIPDLSTVTEDEVTDSEGLAPLPHRVL